MKHPNVGSAYPVDLEPFLSRVGAGELIRAWPGASWARMSQDNDDVSGSAKLSTDKRAGQGVAYNAEIDDFGTLLWDNCSVVSGPNLGRLGTGDPAPVRSSMMRRRRREVRPCEDRGAVTGVGGSPDRARTSV